MWFHHFSEPRVYTYGGCDLWIYGGNSSQVIYAELSCSAITLLSNNKEWSSIPRKCPSKIYGCQIFDIPLIIFHVALSYKLQWYLYVISCHECVQSVLYCIVFNQYTSINIMLKNGDIVTEILEILGTRNSCRPKDRIQSG